MDLKEEKMEKFGLLMLLIGVVMIITSIWIYSKVDNSAYSKTVQMIASSQSDINVLKSQYTSTLSSVNAVKAEVATVTKEIKLLDELCNENSLSIQALQVYCTRLKEKEIAMSEALVKKQDAPIKVEVVSSRKKAK